MCWWPDICSSNGSGKKWSDSGQILQINPIGFADRPGMECELKKGVGDDVKDDSRAGRAEWLK
jgi:hypothetical protein